jgi:hypothetical protein
MKRIIMLVTTCILSSYALLAQTSDTQFAGSIHSEASAQAKTTPVRKTQIKLYPNPSYGKLSISVNTSEVLHFYIFDLEGTLVYQAVLKNRDRKSISHLKKGTYTYDVFEKDESIEGGKIIIK